MRGPISYLDFYLQLSRTERGYRGAGSLLASR